MLQPLQFTAAVETVARTVAPGLQQAEPVIMMQRPHGDSGEHRKFLHVARFVHRSIPPRLCWSLTQRQGQAQFWDFMAGALPAHLDRFLGGRKPSPGWPGGRSVFPLADEPYTATSSLLPDDHELCPVEQPILSWPCPRIRW